MKITPLKPSYWFLGIVGQSTGNKNSSSCTPRNKILDLNALGTYRCTLKTLTRLDGNRPGRFVSLFDARKQFPMFHPDPCLQVHLPCKLCSFQSHKLKKNHNFCTHTPGLFWFVGIKSIFSLYISAFLNSILNLPNPIKYLQIRYTYRGIRVKGVDRNIHGQSFIF